MTEVITRPRVIDIPAAHRRVGALLVIDFDVSDAENQRRLALWMLYVSSQFRGGSGEVDRLILHQ